ncbi:MAG TPA: hypothetical protein VJU16_02025 [Planctomycetota bacterium]|nr:hypothetical protein [Planctomycetota bacterium]
MFHRRSLLLVLMILVPSCSKRSGDTTIINQDVVPANPVVKEWRIPEMLGPMVAGSSASLSDLRFDASGNAFAVYMQNGIWANLWTPASGWMGAGLISDGNPFASSPKITIDAAGNAIVVYSQLDDPSGGPETSIWWNRYTAGVNWQAPQLLETVDEIAGDVQVACDAAGNAIAVWSSSDGSSSDLHFNRYVAGAGWTGAAPLEDGPEISSGARIGMDASGNALAVWNQFDGVDSFSVMASRYLPVSGWTVPIPLVTGLEFTSNEEIAVNAAGDAIAVWTQFDGLTSNLWSASYRPASGWSIATLVETDDWPVSGGLQVGIDATGAGTAAWNAPLGIGTDDRVWSARYSPGGGWTPVELVGLLPNGIGPRLAVQPSGATGIVWLYADGFSTSVLFSSHDGSGPWTSPVFVEFYENQCDNPVLAFDPDGNAMAVWSYYDDVLIFRLWANRYD